MYNKLFSKILDSSIWLEKDTTRIAWITILAAMDEDGFCHFASVGNLAQRAVISREAAEAAVKVLESPDSESSDPDNDGRRIERVPGGWMVLNSKKYHDIAKREHMKEQTRERVKKFRDKQCNADVTPCNDSVTPSDTDTDTHVKERERAAPENFEQIVDAIGHEHPAASHLEGKALPENWKYAIAEAIQRDGVDSVRAGTRNYRDAVSRWPKSDLRFVMDPFKFYGSQAWYAKDPATFEKGTTTHDTAKLTRQQATAVKFESTDRLSILD